MTLLQLSVFYKNLAEMNNAGVSLVSVFETLISAERNPDQNNKIQKIFAHIKMGKPLAYAFTQTNLIPVFDIPIIHSGEKTGNISHVFEVLSKNYEQSSLAEKTIRAGLIKPFFTFAVALFLPSLPDLAANKITFAGYFLRTFGILGAVLVVSYCLYKLFMRSYFDIRLARTRHAFFVKLPFLGNLTKKMALEKFISGLALMLEAGLPIFEALDNAGRNSADIQVFEASQRMISSLKSEKTLPHSFKAESVFTDDIKNSVLLGSESGKLPGFLQRNGQALRTEIFDTIDKISKAIPVIMYWVVTLYVAFVIISSYVGRLNDLNKALQG